MERRRYVVAIFTLAVALAASRPTVALGRLADVSVIDRDSGAVLMPHYWHGEYWIAGIPGARFEIQVRNRLGERLLAVTSVDGVNVVTGVTAAWGQSGYVFGPEEQYPITGWRKSDSAVAAFIFTDASRSYAQLTGREANIGVIGIALFRERPPPAVYAPRPESILPPADAGNAASETNSGRSAAQAATPLASNSARSGAELAPSVMVPKLGTGHGGREYSYVSHTEFERAAEQPDEVIRIRYDSFDNLVALGIVKRPRPDPPAANPFPGSLADHYVPDPPG
jgi:hypothetical protein